MAVTSTLLTVLAAAAAAPGATAAPDHRSGGGDLTTARQATASYHQVDVATAAGYGLPPTGPLHECIASLDPMMPGAMGYHLINGAAVGDSVLDPAVPEALVYEAGPDGTLRLVALEHVVFQDVWEADHGATVPWLFGRPMTHVPAPNRYELPAFYQIHTWLWKANPHGIHADHNPRVSCG